MPIDYGDRVPMLERFKHDSSVPMAIRTKDTVLTAIDARLAEYEKRPLNRFEVMVDLFLSINLWIKCYHQQQPGFLKGRYPAIAALNEVVIHTLMQLTGAATPGHVMREIQAIIGLNINDSGKQTDKTMYARFYDAAQREKTRIHFKGGTAFRYMMDTAPERKGLHLLDSSTFENREVARCGEASLNGFAPFVMSMERVFYMARLYLPEHDGLGKLNARFHSTYFGNDCRISAAGTMLIERGEVKAIRGDSGHYMPGEHNLAQAIRALQGYGVNIDRLRVYSWRANPSHKQATAFQQDHFMLSSAPHSIPAVRPRGAPVNYDWIGSSQPSHGIAPLESANVYSHTPGDDPAYAHTPADYQHYRQTPANDHHYDHSPSDGPQPVSGAHYLRSQV